MNGLDKRRIILAGGAAAMLAVATLPGPSADIRILTHDVTDTAPRKIQAALNLGILAISILYTWSERAIR